MESLDYRHHRIHLNPHTAQLERDGSLRIVVAHRDPGPRYPNWLETTGHTRAACCSAGSARRAPADRDAAGEARGAVADVDRSPDLFMVDFVARDMDATIGFYPRSRRRNSREKRSGARRAVLTHSRPMPGGLVMPLRQHSARETTTAAWQETVRRRDARRAELSRRSRADVRTASTTHHRPRPLERTAAVSTRCWGARYAIVVDPDGNHIGLMSPSDPALRRAPPVSEAHVGEPTRSGTR
jgi:hypothetical protein